jgi:hypothetical protein
MIVAKDGSMKDRSTINPDRNNFGPRCGFAWTVAGRIVGRGGYGLSYVARGSLRIAPGLIGCHL